MHVARSDGDDDAVGAHARLRGRLEHPAIAPLYDAGLTRRGRAFFTTKHVRGVSLERALAALRSRPVGPSGRLGRELSSSASRRRLLAAFGQACLAVAYAHEQGVCHGAISPRVVVLGSFGEVYIEGWSQGEVPSDVARLGGILRSILDACGTVVPELDALCERTRTLGPEAPSARAMNEAIEAFLSGDRDAEVRRALARTHLALAQRASERAFADAERPAATASGEGPSASLEGASRARIEALREIGRAVRLAPDDPDAVGLFVQLMTAPPPRPPPEVLAEVERLREERARGPAIATVLFGALWLVLYPLVVLLLGVRQMAPVIAVWIAWTLAEVALLLAILRARQGRRAGVPWPMLAAMLAVMATAALSGPFFVTPVIATMTTMSCVLVVGRRWRPATMAFGALVILVPTALAWTGVLPTIDVVGDVVASNGALRVPSRPTTCLVLTVVHLLAVLFAAAYAATFRDRLDDVETGFLVRMWQLTKLLPRTRSEERRGAGEPAPSNVESPAIGPSTWGKVRVR